MKAKEKTLLRFKQRIDEGKSLKYKDFKEEDSSLLWAVERYYSGIFKAAQELEITEEELLSKFGLTRNINKKTLSKDEMKSRLLFLKSKGKLSTSAMRTEFNDLRLEISMKKTFGSVQNGLEYYGLEGDTVRLEKKKLIKEIKDLHDSGENLSYTFMIENHSKLIYNSTNKFGLGWYGLLDKLDIPYEAIRKRFTKESIKQRVDTIYNKYGEMNHSILKKYDSSILYYAYDNYESIIDFFIDMEFNPNECLDFSRPSIKGFSFERVFKEVLDLMGLKYKYNKFFDENNTIRPDFQMEDGTWIDCKLSSWTSTIEDTIKKYLPHCKKLQIVYLRGNNKHLRNLKKKYESVDFIPFNSYKYFLESINRQDIIKKSENIVNHNFCEETLYLA